MGNFAKGPINVTVFLHHYSLVIPLSSFLIRLVIELELKSREEGLNEWR